MKKKTIKKIGIAFSSLVAIGGISAVATSLLEGNLNRTSNFVSNSVNDEMASSTSRDINISPTTKKYTFTSSDVTSLLNSGKVNSKDSSDVVKGKNIKVYNPNSALALKPKQDKNSISANELDTANTFLTNGYKSGWGVPNSGRGTVGSKQENYAFRVGSDNQWYFDPQISSESQNDFVDLALDTSNNKDASSTYLKSSYGFKIYNNNDTNVDKTYSDGYEGVTTYSNAYDDNDRRVYYNRRAANISNTAINGVVKIQLSGLEKNVKISLGPDTPVNGLYENYYAQSTPEQYFVLTDFDERTASTTNQSLNELMSSSTQWSKATKKYLFNGSNLTGYQVVFPKSLTLTQSDVKVGTCLSAVNIGLFDGKIYLGSTGSSISASKKSGVTFGDKSLSPQQFVDKIASNPLSIFDYVDVSFVNTPRFILDNGFSFTIKNDESNQRVVLSFETTKSFVPSTSTNNNGDLTDADWIKDSAMKSVEIFAPYSNFSTNTSKTTCKSSISVSELNIPNVNNSTFADNFIVDPNSTKLVYNQLSQNPSILFSNLPVSNTLSFIKDGVNGITLKNGKTTNTVDMTFSYLSNNGTSINTDDTYVNTTVTINGFKDGVTTVNNNIDLSLTVLNQYTTVDISQNLTLLTDFIKKDITNIFSNVSTHFVSENKAKLVVESVKEQNSSAGTISVNVNIIGLGTSTGYKDSSIVLNFSGLKPLKESTISKNGEFYVGDFPTSLSPKTYFVDIKDSSTNIMKNMLAEMNTNPTKYLDNSIIANGKSYFTDLQLIATSAKEGSASFSVNYLISSNGTQTYKNGNFKVLGFNTNKTVFNSELAASLAIPESSSNIENSELVSLKNKQPSQISGLVEQQETIKKIIISKFDSLFINQPLSFAHKNSNITLSNFVANDQSGTLSFDASIYVVDDNGDYVISKFPFTLGGFSTTNVNNPTSLISQINIADLAIPSLSGKSYSVQFMQNIQSTSSQLLSIINSKPQILLQNLPTLSQINNRPVFKLRYGIDSFKYVSSDISKVQVSVEYLKSNGNVNELAQYVSGEFTINFNSNVSNVLAQYSASSVDGYAISGLENISASLTIADSVKKTIISTINNDINVIFGNSLPTNSSIKDFQINNVDQRNGSMLISFDVQNAFYNNSYLTKTFSMKISGFKKEASSTVITALDTISIDQLASIANNTITPNNTLFNSLVGKYSKDAFNVIDKNRTSFVNLLETIVNKNPLYFVSYIDQSKSFSAIKSGSISFKGAVDNSIEVSASFISSYTEDNANYTNKSFKIVGFNKNKTETTRENIISPKQLSEILGDISRITVDQAVQKLTSDMNARTLLINSLNENAKSFFVPGTINDELQQKINSGTLVTNSNLIINKSLSRVGEGLQITIDAIPLSDALGNVSVSSQVILNSLNAKPNEEFNFATQTVAPQSASSSDNTWIWILIGCLLGGAALIILAYFLYRYLRNRPKTYKTSVGDVETDSYDDFDDDNSSYSDDYYDYF